MEPIQSAYVHKKEYELHKKEVSCKLEEHEERLDKHSEQFEEIARQFQGQKEAQIVSNTKLGMIEKIQWAIFIVLLSGLVLNVVSLFV